MAECSGTMSACGDSTNNAPMGMIPPWLRWTLIAIFSWGIWAVISKLPGDAVTAGQSQALSTLGLLPMLPLLRRAKFRGASTRGLLLAVAGGVVTCLGN